MLNFKTRERNNDQRTQPSTCSSEKKSAKTQRKIEMKQTPYTEKETSNLLGMYIYLELINVMLFCSMQ